MKLNEVSENYQLKETSTIELLQTIWNCKKNLKSSKWDLSLKLFWVLIIIPATIYFFNVLNIKTVFIYEYLSDLLTLISILIGFNLTALSIIGTGLSQKVLEKTFKIESIQNNKTSIYQTTILVFFDYIYSLLTTLIFIIICLFLYPFVHSFSFLRFFISIPFFYILLLLIYWNIFSIISLVFNLYCIIMLSAQINTMQEKSLDEK